MLEIKDLCVSYGAIDAVKGISLKVNDGEIVSLIGANGAGKTTTLHTITGLVPAKSGSITYDGHDLLKTHANKIVTLGMAHVPEGRHVFTRMPTETEDLLHCINTIRDRFGIAILLIEHDMSLVMSVCQRIQVLDYGRTIASGTPEEIANNPQVISAYLGSDNNDDADGDSTTKAEPEPSIAKTLTEGAR